MSRKTSRAPTPDAQSSPVTIGTKLRYSRAEVCFLLGMSEAQLAKRIHAGALRTIADGRRRYVLDAELRRYASEPR